jgi:putative toxin-antitoxin system antitoxin component (TIGR02293 family)
MSHEIIQNEVLSPAAFLGGEKILSDPPDTPLDWIGLVRNGLPAAALQEILRRTRVSQSTLAEALAIPPRTLARSKREGAFSPEVSAKLVRFARIAARAEEVLGDSESAQDWLRASNRSLGGWRPLFLLDTDIGAEVVLDALGRIEHGVFA